MPFVSILARLASIAAPITRGLTFGVRGACFDADGRIFLVRHSYIPGWHMPGGGVERNESVTDALERELREEGGIVLGEPASVFGIYRGRKRGSDHVVLFLCRSFSRPNPPKYPNWEIAEATFFDPAALPADTSPATVRRLDEILQAGTPARRW